MGLEHLKSIFKEGFPGPVNGWPNIHDTGFKLNLGEGSKTQFILGDTLPVLDSIQRGSSYQFVSEDLTTKLYNSEFFDPRVGRPRGPIYNINAYEGTRFDDGVGGLFNQSERYYGGFGNINTPKFTDIINSGNVTTNAGGYLNLTGLLERYENINPQNESRPKPEGYLKDGKINTNRTWTQSSIPQFNDLYSTEGGQEKRTITIDLVNDLQAKTLEGTSWESLYNPEHTAKDGVGYHYPNVSRKKSLNLRYSSGGGVFGDPRTQLLGLGAGEPYIISKIPTDGGLKGGRLTNFASRDIPFVRAATDTLRLTNYLSSPAGIAFIAKQNTLGAITKVQFRDGDKLMEGKQRFKEAYNPLSTLAAAGSRLLGTQPNILYDREFPSLVSSLFKDTKYSDSTQNKINFMFMDASKGGLLGGIFNQVKSKIGSAISTALGTANDITPEPNGDLMTTITFGLKDLDGKYKETLKTAHPNDSPKIESSDYGMPFYFKDLRDGAFVLFRAYIESLTENISPSWSSTNYIGRSEPVYIYERAERDISFTLKMFAHTEKELESIYQKMNRLTSMCYPQYVEDKNLNNKLRMKPPLLKFRLGELFGSENNEMLGFLKSCSYSYPDTSPWSTEQGKRVPKHITVSTTYQVIHMEVPSLDFAKKGKGADAFYGIVSPKNDNGISIGA